MDGRQRVLEARAAMREIEVENIMVRFRQESALAEKLKAAGRKVPRELYDSIKRDAETASLIMVDNLDLRAAQQRVAEKHRTRRECR